MELPIINRIVKGNVSDEMMRLLPPLERILRTMRTKRHIDIGTLDQNENFLAKAKEIYDYLKENIRDHVDFWQFENDVVSNIKMLKDIWEGEGTSEKTKLWLERWHKKSSAGKYPERKPTMEDIEIRKEDIRDYASRYWKTLNLGDDELYAKMQKLETDMGMKGKNWQDWYFALGEMRDFYYNKTHSKVAQYFPSSPKTPRMQEHHKRMEKDMVSGPEAHTTLPQSKMEKDILKTPTGFHNADIVVNADDIMVKATGEPDQDYDHDFYDKIVEQLDAAGFPGATHREFDKYQGVYLNVPGIDKFWVRSVFVDNDGVNYVMVPEKDRGGRGWSVVQLATRGSSGLEFTGEINASELIEYCKEETNKPSEKTKEWEERWHKKSELYPERYMGDPRGQMEMPGTVEIINLTIIPGDKEIPSKAIDRLEPLPQYWYENEEGIKHIPTEEEMHGEPFFPKDFPIQHCLTPELVEEINYTDDRGHLMTGHKTINCIEDIVLYLVLQRGWKMTDAIVSAAETCERCLNILIEESGGEKYDQHEKDTCHTHCEQCAIVDPEYDKAFKQHEKEREMGMHHENDAHLIEENNTDLVKESSLNNRRKKVIALARYFIRKYAQQPEEFKTNMYVIFTQDCRFKMEQMDAVGEIKENMVGKVTNVSDEGITVEIGKQAYRIPYIDAFKVMEPFQAKVISPEQEAKEQGGMEGEELVPEEQPEGKGEEPAVTRPETTMERGPVPIRAPMKPLEKALQTESVLRNMMKKMGVEDPRKQLAKDTPVMVNGKPGRIVNFIGSDYQIQMDNGKVMIVPIEAISTQETPLKPVQEVKTPLAPAKETPKPLETPKQPIVDDFPVGSDVWVTIQKETGFPQHTRGTVIRIQDEKYTIRKRSLKGGIVEADKSQLSLISRPEKPTEERMPYPPYRYSKRGLAPVYPKDEVPKNTFVYVELEKGETPLYFGRVVDEANDMLGVEVLAEERSDYFPRDQVFYVKMPLAVREQMMEKFKDWTTDTQATVLDRTIITADIIDTKRQEEKMERVILGQIEINDQMLDDAGMWLSRELWEPKVKEISKEIESLLGQVERGVNVAPQMISYVEDLGEILEKIPHDQLIAAGEYLSKLWEEEGKKSPVAFISFYLEKRAGDDMTKKPLKELNKIVKERSKEKLKDQKDDMKGVNPHSREVSRDNVHQDINFQSRMSTVKIARKFGGGVEVELLTGIWKGQRGKIKEFNPGFAGRSKDTYRIEVDGNMIWKNEDELKSIEEAKPEPVAVPVASSEFKGIVADISAGYRTLMDEIEHSANPYIVSDIGKKLMKKENKEASIVREGGVSR